MHRSIIGGEFGERLALRARRTLRRRHHRGPQGLRCGGILVIEQERLERLAHVPLDIVGKHAQRDVGAHALFEAMVNRADLEVDRLETAESLFDVGQALIGSHGVLRT